MRRCVRVARENSAIERFGLCKVTRPMLLDSDRELVACVLSRCSRRLFYRHVRYHVIGKILRASSRFNLGNGKIR